MLCFLTETNAGRLDGEICRMQRLSSQYPNLALVRMPLCSVQLVAVAARPLLLSGWEDFAALRVAHRRGVVGLRTLLPFGTSVMLAPDPNKVLDLVTGGRVDVALLARAALEPRIRASQYAHLRVISLPFGRIDLYHYLHKCHADLVPRVESALHEFVAE
jgi:polar amino acid transport system substrate-binding protein